MSPRPPPRTPDHHRGDQEEEEVDLDGHADASPLRVSTLSTTQQRSSAEIAVQSSNSQPLHVRVMNGPVVPLTGNDLRVEGTANQKRVLEILDYYIQVHNSSGPNDPISTYLEESAQEFVKRNVSSMRAQGIHVDVTDENNIRLHEVPGVLKTLWPRLYVDSQEVAYVRGFAAGLCDIRMDQAWDGASEYNGD